MEWRIKKLLLEPHRSLTLGPRYEIGPLSNSLFSRCPKGYHPQREQLPVRAWADTP